MSDDQVEVVVVDLSDMAAELEGPDFYKQPIVYHFGGGKRDFKDPGEDGKLYSPPP